ncbi:recombination regulator RecX [Paraburkholderia sp. BL10I2N1]|uniref:recombination regulator RecX n=1 Tax=Paraburkholderia sp. BL10I2N1 TaxID=1938796 RepID=UPI00105B998B|nr:recombination regulator RecX [Paraburkholderia sp. BL10I2N1]TDN68543.1 regulatory protein [Paraburkholderia sp. BL10I2N1]
MIRKGRPVLHAGHDAGDPRDDVEVEPRESGSSHPSSPSRRTAPDSSGPALSSGDLPASLGSSQDSFDPFESFDAHDRAAGHLSSGSARTGAASDQAPEESTYTRSRRAPGDAPAIGKQRASNSQRPAPSLKGRALGYLSRREYSRAELSRKLTHYAEEPDALELVLDALEREGWLSDSRFAESLIHRRASRVGASRIVNELKRHAVGQTLIEEASAQLRETELARAQAVWRKKFGQIPETPAERAKQKRFLAARGFSGSTISKILKGIDEEWPDSSE